jgi:hypothetical protein
LTQSKINDINSALIDFIVLDLKSFSSLDKPGLRRLMSVMEDRYTVPDRNSMQFMVRQHAKSAREEVYSALAKTEMLSLTLDGWTSSAKQKFLGITAHWIDASFHLHRIALDLYPTDASQTTQNLLQAVRDMLANAKISINSIIAITTDNG